ncbi:hypothetical protein BCR44DRAFT_1439710 [Catenaria anguillulae PL171]|uniref:Uncharacterized protein n=1 Tax=Catenaria anguillulae PL171 TaxID=765915 RepID=A0A1Y2HFA5_9FUNG|nr:hypothetical protein BCR44DRAFT_1439710 [Catenaria anguillulae PL171]
MILDPWQAAAARIWSDELLDVDYALPSVLAIMAANVLLSTVLVIIAIRRVAIHATKFNIGVLLSTLVLSLNDVWFWVIVGFRIAPYTWEIARTFIPVVAASMIAGLTFERFRIFGATSLAAWYTDRVRRGLLLFNFTLMAIGLGLLASTYANIDINVKIPEVRSRKFTILAVIGFSVLADFILTIIIFHIVLSIRKTLDSTLSVPYAKASMSGNETMRAAVTNAASFLTMSETARLHFRKGKQEYRRLVGYIIGSLVGMVVCTILGIVCYIFGRSVVGHQLANISVRAYVLCAIIEWALVVDLVRGRGRCNISSSLNTQSRSCSEQRSASQIPQDTRIYALPHYTNTSNVGITSSTGSSTTAHVPSSPDHTTIPPTPTLPKPTQIHVFPSAVAGHSNSTTYHYQNTPLSATQLEFPPTAYMGEHELRPWHGPDDQTRSPSRSSADAVGWDRRGPG